MDNYRQLVNSRFKMTNSSWGKLNTSNSDVIAALNRSDNSFRAFSAAFKARLQRLSSVYKPGTRNYNKLLRQVKLIADAHNWKGAYSELAAYDYFHHSLKSNDVKFEPMDLTCKVPSSDTFAPGLGSTGNADLDGHFSQGDVYTDIKSLKDVVTELLESVARDAARKLQVTGLVVLPQYPAGLDYAIVQDYRDKLVNELITAIESGDQPAFVQSKLIEGLSYRLGWKAGVTFSEREIDPYEAAAAYHQLVFGYANKFTLHKPFLLVLVAFDWFHSAPNDFSDYDLKFYRAFARRVFMQYMHSSRRFVEVNPRFTGDETIFDVTRKIGGILFLRDRCVTAKCPELTNVDAYMYWNPNAEHSLINNKFREYLLAHELEMVDGFRGDVY
ncbi:MAG: hypothetical protein ACRD22_05395 [Terriglobia bacterium]